MNDTTAYLVADAASGPGEYVKRFASARPVKGALTPAQSALVRRMDGTRLGFVSKALVYDSALRHLSKAEAAMFARLVKGGALYAEPAERREDGYVLRASESQHTPNAAATAEYYIRASGEPESEESGPEDLESLIEANWAALEDSPDIVRRLRNMKPGAEIEFGHRAGESAVIRRGGPRESHAPNISNHLAEGLVFKAIEDDQAERSRPLASMGDVRLRVRLSPEDFDRAIIGLSRKHRVSLHHHDYPASLSTAERKACVELGGRTYNAVSTRAHTSNHSRVLSRSQEIREGSRWRSRSTGYLYTVSGVSDQAVQVTPIGKNHIDADEASLYSFENFIKDFVPSRAVREYAANRAGLANCNDPEIFPARHGVHFLADQDRNAVVLAHRGEQVYLINPFEYEDTPYPEDFLWVVWVKGSRTVRVAWWGQKDTPQVEAVESVSDWLDRTCFPGLAKTDDTQAWGVDVEPKRVSASWQPIVDAAAWVSTELQKTQGGTMARNARGKMRKNYSPHGFALVRDDGRIVELGRSRDYLETKWTRDRDLVELAAPHKVGDVITYDHLGKEVVAMHHNQKSNGPPHARGIDLYREAKAAGLEMDHHESDLYLRYTPQAVALLKKHGYSHVAGGKMVFSDQKGDRWLDVPFAYEPFWEKKSMRTNTARRYSRLEDNPQLFPERDGVRFYATEDKGVMLVDEDGRDYYIVNPLEYEKKSRYAGSQPWVLWFGEGLSNPVRLLYWYNGNREGLEDALEECGEWLADHAPGLIMKDDSEELTSLFNEAKEEILKKKPNIDPEKLDGDAYEEATVDHTYTESGWISSQNWGIDLQPDAVRGDSERFVKAAAWVSLQLKKEAYPDEEEDEDTFYVDDPSSPTYEFEHEFVGPLSELSEEYELTAVELRMAQGLRAGQEVQLRPGMVVSRGGSDDEDELESNSAQPFRGGQMLVIEKRKRDGSLDFSAPQPPKAEAKFDDVYEWYFRAHPSAKSAGWSDLKKWLDSKGWKLRAKTW